MSLIRFLTSGSRGLTKGAAPMGRYRLPDGRLIPSFGNGTNPFQSKNLPSRADTSVPAGDTARAALTQAAPPSLVQSPFGGGKARSISTIRDTGARLFASMKSVGSKGLGACRTYGMSLLTKLRRGKQPSALATSSKPMVAGPVQGELSLERVRVVRNDLTDTDYEVVSSETVTASPVKKVPQAVAVQAGSRPLGRLAERLFSHRTH